MTALVPIVTGGKSDRESTSGHTVPILAATLFAGCAWTDSPDTGMSAMATAHGSRGAAVYLAREVRDARHQ